MTAPPSRSLRVLALVLATACGLTVANLYYCQPLLGAIAGSFHVGEGTAATVVTVTQIGYAFGLLFLLPLGDLLENRRLITRTLVGTAVALVAAGASPGFGFLIAVSVLVGLTSVVAQILVPFAAHLAPEGQEGRFVGQVMSGLLLGILLARSAAGLLAAATNWRAIFFVSAGLMIVLAVVLRRLLPTRRPVEQHSYPALLGTVRELVRHEPVLRRLALCQATMFGAFTAYWTAIAYELTSAHHLGQGAIGVFALVGAGGAAAAPVAGQLADRGYGRPGRGVTFVVAAASCSLAGLGAGSIVALAAGGVLLDFAVQSHQVMSQQVIYTLRPESRARVNTVYMTTIFTGGAVSSAIAGALHSAYGWSGVMAFAALLPLAGLALWGTGRTTAPAGTDAVPAGGVSSR